MLILVKKLTHLPEGTVEEVAERVAKAIRAGYDVVIVAGDREKAVWRRVDQILMEAEDQNGE